MDCEGLPNGPELTVCQAARAAADAADAARKLAEGDSWSEIVVAILGAIGALALPVMAIVIIVLVWPILRAVFETRKFTLKIGGFELSAQEATDQIRKQIEELQAQIAELKEGGMPVFPPLLEDPFAEPAPDQPSFLRPSSPAPAKATVESIDAAPRPVSNPPVQPDRPASPADPAPPAAPSPSPPPVTQYPTAPRYAPAPPARSPQTLPGAILWVDDKPSNNAFLIAEFQDQKITVDQAVSTAEALQKLAAGSASYRVIISDLGRMEDKTYVPDAGGQLAKAVKAMGLTTPVIIFSSARAAQDQDRLIKLGAMAVTNSSTRLRSLVLKHFRGIGG